jgi:hypothetical protein
MFMQCIFQLKALIKSKDQFNTKVVLLEREVEIQKQWDDHGRLVT